MDPSIIEKRLAKIDEDDMYNENLVSIVKDTEISNLDIIDSYEVKDVAKKPSDRSTLTFQILSIDIERNIKNIHRLIEECQ